MTNKIANDYLEPAKHAGGASREDATEKLSSIIEWMNERFGTDFTHLDKIINEAEKHMKENEEIIRAAENNFYDNYRYSFTPRLTDYVIENIEVREESIKLLENPGVLAFLDKYLSWKIYNELNR